MLAMDIFQLGRTQKARMYVIFILFLSPSYHFPNATNNLWSPPLCTFKQRISPKLQSDTALQCLMLAEFLITNLFFFFSKTSIPGLVLDLEAGGPACSRRAGAWWSLRFFPTRAILWFYERNRGRSQQFNLTNMLCKTSTYPWRRSCAMTKCWHVDSRWWAYRSVLSLLCNAFISWYYL